MKRIATFTQEYEYFEPGTKVTPNYSGFLEFGKIYIVEKCFSPLYAGDDAIVYLEGEKHGYRTELLREVT